MMKKRRPGAPGKTNKLKTTIKQDVNSKDYVHLEKDSW